MPKYGASRLMSQSFRAETPSVSRLNHSRTLFATSGCNLPSWVQFSRNSTQRGSLSLKKKCSLLRNTGVAPDSADLGWIKSVGAYTAPQFSQLSPYWSGVPHFGQVPLINRSGKNMPLSGS